MKKAIVTLAIGNEYINEFNQLCKANWQKYCDKYNYDLICITSPLDNSERAQARSPAWQKCLVLSQDWSQKYDRIVWVDTDVLINSNSPDISENIPIEKIGITDEFSQPNKEFYKLAIERMNKTWEKIHPGLKLYTTAEEFYKHYGFDDYFEEVAQTGVMVLSPKYHRELFEHVYYNYEEKGLNYEMRPLSYEIIKNEFAHFIDQRFNYLWLYDKVRHYPFTFEEKKHKKLWGFIKRKNKEYDKFRKHCLQTAFVNSYFMHFVARSNEIRNVNTEIDTYEKIMGAF